MSRGCDSFAVLVHDYIASGCDSGPVSLVWEGRVCEFGKRKRPGKTREKEDDERRAEPGVSGESTRNRSYQSERARKMVREGMRERAAARECKRKERWGRTREGTDDVGGREEKEK